MRKSGMVIRCWWIMAMVLMDICEGFQECKKLQCAHQSPCMSAIITHSNGSLTTKEHCICTGSYIGPRCEWEMTIKPVSIEATNVMVQLLCNASVCYPDTELTNFEYSLVYWTNSSKYSCSVRSQTEINMAYLNDLMPSTAYTVCVKSGLLDWCSPLFDMYNTTKECIMLQTLSPSHVDDPVSFESLVVLCLTAILACSIIILICFVVCKRKVLCKRYSKLSGKQNINGDIELSAMLKNDYKPYEPPSIHAPSSPGRLHHKISQRSTGFATFSARNSRTIALKSVMEYNEDNSEEKETSLMLKDQRTL